MAARLLPTMHGFGQGGVARVAMLVANGFAAAGREATIEALRDPARVPLVAAARTQA